MSILLDMEASLNQGRQVILRTSNLRGRALGGRALCERLCDTVSARCALALGVCELAARGWDGRREAGKLYGALVKSSHCDMGRLGQWCCRGDNGHSSMLSAEKGIVAWDATTLLQLGTLRHIYSKKKATYSAGRNTSQVLCVDKGKRSREGDGR
jgi:hypothetical protein